MDSRKHITQFNTQQLDPSHRFDFWYSLMNQRGTAISMDVAAPRLFNGRGKSVMLDDLLITHLVNSANTVIRSERHISFDTDLYYLIHLPLTEGLTLMFDKQALTLPASSLTILNTEFPLNAAHNGLNYISLKIPMHALPDIKIEQACIMFQRHQLPFYLQSLLINTAYMSFSYPLEKSLQVQMRNELLAAITALVNGTTYQSSYMKRFFFEQICSLIEQFYQSPLSLEDIAKKLNISKAYIHKILSSHDVSFRQLVTQERLQSSLPRLLHKDRHILKVSDIALDAGYKNESHFSNTFKKYFSCTPMKFYRMFG